MRDHDEVRALLDGPVNSLPTIFTESGEIDYDGTRAVIDKSLEGNCNVIMLTWGDSLISLLTDDEVAELHRVVIEHVDGRALTIACDNQWGLNKAVEFGRFVRELGFDLYMVRPADWAKGTPETLADFYKACGRVAPVMFVGDVPIRTLELVADDPNMWAFKEDLTLDYAHEVIMRWGDRWPMTGGGGIKRHYVLWPHGNCNAWLDVFIYCNLSPQKLYWEAIKRNDLAEAWRLARHYEQPIWDLWPVFPAGGDGLVHTMIEVCGVAPRWRRSPAPNATEEDMEQVRDMLRGLGLL